MTEPCLPDGFADLAPFVKDWSLATAFERDAQRGAKSVDERQRFYDAFTPRLSQVLETLDRTPLDQHARAERTLMRMALSYAHVAQSVEVHGPDEAKHARGRSRLPITNCPADN